MRCPNCEALVAELDAVRAERDLAREQAAKATDLMMKGEAVRQNLLLKAITGELLPPPRSGGRP